MDEEIPYVWGATSAEVASTYGCDGLVPEPRYRLVRAVSSSADTDSAYRWLCQLRVAPYSYDWIDNFGRRSPRALVPGADHLAVGQRVMTIFTLASFIPGEELTLLLTPSAPTAVFGELAVSYAVRPTRVGSRIVAVLSCAGGTGPLDRARQALLPWGDLLMMRKQLRTLAALASH